MTLTRRTLLTSVLLSLVAASALAFAVAAVRSRDRMRALDRVSAAFQTELARDSCESDPQWFLAGPRTGRPRLEDRQIPDADVKLPRPSAEPLPFELFAYDYQFLGSSTAAPRFPDEFKRRMRESPPQRVVSGRYESDGGTGLQIARWTGWTTGPCAVLLFRLAPEPGAMWTSLALFSGFFGVCLVVALVAGLPIASRVRRLALAARASAREDYAEMAPISGRDEIGSLGSTFNDAATDIRVRITDARDREEALQRYVANTTEDVAEPLAQLESRIARLAGGSSSGSEAAEAAREISRETHRLTMRLKNLAAVAKLRTITDATPRERVDLSGIAARVVADRAALAAAAGVILERPALDPDVTIDADAALVQLAVANLVDNAILYAGAGARVRVVLTSYEHGARFALRVADSGRGVTDEEFAGLTANRRFRGDEAKTRRPGGRGLGLALAREVADRFGMTLDLRRPTAGGFEVELASR